MAINAFVDASLPRETFFLFSNWQLVFFIIKNLLNFFKKKKATGVLKI